MMNINGSDTGGKSIAGNWTAAVVVAAIGIVVACFWYLLNISNQITLLQQQVHELQVSQSKNEGIIQQNGHDIEDIKRRLDNPPHAK